jgi:hypothetical protein
MATCGTECGEEWRVSRALCRLCRESIEEYTALLPKEGTVEQLRTWGYPGLEQDAGLKQKLTDGIRDSKEQEEEPMVLGKAKP